MVVLFAKRTNVLLYSLIMLWGLISLISVNHLFVFCPALQLSSSTLGYLAWCSFAITIVFLGCRYWKQLLLVCCLFFLFGYSVGPFLEPPSDPLDHLRHTYATCDKNSQDFKELNGGLWQYSMLGNILCHERYSLAPKDVLRKIDIANGIFWATGASVLFVVGLRAGLSAGWALFSVCLAFLFMGTSRFSYFSYYSFAHSFSSLWIFWLWIAAFFFQKQGRYLLLGILAAGCSLPILITNHIQEAIFLFLVCGVWVFLFLLRAVTCYFSRDLPLWRNIRWWLFLVCLFSLFFVLPQWSFFQRVISQLFINDNWQLYQDAVFSWHGIHFIGRIWEYRIHDTLGLLGFLPVLLMPLFIFSKVVQQNNEKKWQILLLGVLPFFVYCIPLLNFIWLSNCVHYNIYYRMCYSSLFWLPVTLVLHDVGLHLKRQLPWNSTRSQKIVSRLYLSFCLLCFVIVSGMQSAPIYGKLDFITVDSRKWWDAWHPMIEKVFTWKKEKIETDYITGYVLNAVFNVRLKQNQFNLLTMDEVPKRSIETMIENSKDDRTGCLINLHGFSPTWVPLVTGHWSSDLSQPSLLYQTDVAGKTSLSKYLNDNTLGKCYVFPGSYGN